MPEVNMPKLSDTMEEGTVLSWKKQDGDEVKKGEPIAEIETDKASFEIEADADGVLQIVVQPGQPVPVGAVIGNIGDGGAPQQQPAQKQPTAQSEAGAQAPPSGQEGPEGGPDEGAEAPQEAAPTPAPKRGQSGGGRRPSQEAPPDEMEPTPEAPTAEREPAAGPSGDGRAPTAPEGVRASPLARRLAQQMGVDLASIKGSGPEGRIVKEDVLAASQKAPRPQQRPQAQAQAQPQPQPQQPSPTPRAAPAPAADVEVEELSRMQATIARRMTQSKQSVPHFYVTAEARVDRAVELRAQMKEAVAGADKVTVTDMLVRACALALRKFPDVNASWADGRIERKRHVNIGIAVAQPKGLIVPVIKDVDHKDLVAISIESRQLVERARAGKLSQQDLEGGTFSVSNLGMFGVDEFAAIINPPEAAILAVGTIKDAPVVDAGVVKPGKLMRMTISVDHRVFYGATAAEFLAEVKRLIENPVSLVIPPGEDT